MDEARPDDADALLDELGSQEREEPDEDVGPPAAAALPEPIVIEAGEIYQSTGCDRAGAEQCSSVWLAMRVSQGPQQYMKPRSLFSDDAYWDWWAGSPGLAGGIPEKTLLHISTEEPCNVLTLPRNCQ